MNNHSIWLAADARFAELLPHIDPAREIDWSKDGHTAIPGLRCAAVSEAAIKRQMLDVRCPKEAVVQLVLTYGTHRSQGLANGFCGTHFLQHRRGTAVKLAGP